MEMRGISVLILVHHYKLLLCQWLLTRPKPVSFYSKYSTLYLLLLGSKVHRLYELCTV